MGNNGLKGTEAGKALGGAIAANTVLKELDLSSPTIWTGSTGYSSPCDTAFTKEFAAGLSANGALETITFGDNRVVTMKTDMTEAYLSGKYLKASDAVVLAAFLPNCR